MAAMAATVLLEHQGDTGPPPTRNIPTHAWGPGMAAAGNLFSNFHFHLADCEWTGRDALRRAALPDRALCSERGVAQRMPAPRTARQVGHHDACMTCVGF